MRKPLAGRTARSNFVVSALLSRVPMSSARVAGAFCALLLLAVEPARAIEFGPHGALALRGRFYTQYTIATEQSQPYSQPRISVGNMKQWRNFYNPEFEVDFRKLAGTAVPLRKYVDELSGRVTIWGFYDGIYDFGPKEWAQGNASTKLNRNSVPASQATTAFYSEGHTVNDALNNRGRRRDAREFYGRRTRVNEAYVNVAKGPFFMRIGRQAISWGEADTIGLLDLNNPRDILLQPGLQIDLDEARIPLWTLRMTYELFDVAGPFSSGFAEAYWVPGWLDVDVGFLPIMGVSPYSPPPPIQGPGIQVYDKLPRYETGNSRYGFRFQTVYDRDYNLSVWFYRTFQLVPVQTLAGISAGPQNYVTAILHHGLVNVWGGAASWYSDRLNSIVRTEVELFNNEPGFLAYKGVGAPVASGFTQPGTYETANVIRGEIGVDYNFFVPWLNPSASFLAVNSLVFEWNTSETDNKDFRNPFPKPSAILRQLSGGAIAGQVAPPSCDNKNTPAGAEGRCDYVNLDPFEAFVQQTIRSDFMHGRLTPQLTTIVTFRGAITFSPQIDYRFSDLLQFQAKYINTHTFGSGENNGYTKGVGLMRDRDQVWLRATVQLN